MQVVYYVGNKPQGHRTVTVGLIKSRLNQAWTEAFIVVQQLLVVIKSPGIDPRIGWRKTRYIVILITDKGGSPLCLGENIYNVNPRVS